MRIKCIINPAAGKGKAAEVWQQVKNLLANINKDIQYEFTKRPGHAKELAKKAVKEGVDVLAVIGGDGTVHEAVNGLIEGDTSLAVFPAGTGNDFAKTMKISKNNQKTAALLSSYKKKKIDIAKLNGDYFINMAGIGLDAEVASRVNKNRYLKGEIAYFSAILRTLVKYRAVSLEIVIDGVVRYEKVMMVAIGNGQYVGGGIRILPQASVDDGMLDICIIKETTKLEALKTLPAVYAGRHTSHPKCIFLKGRSIVIKVLNNQPQTYTQIDGQVSCQDLLDINVMPSALSVLVPQGNI